MRESGEMAFDDDLRGGGMTSSSVTMSVTETIIPFWYGSLSFLIEEKFLCPSGTLRNERIALVDYLR